jgi:hypothetical protein
MSTVAKQLRSSYGFESPYFIVDSSGNLVTQTITVTGNRIELTQGSYISYNGQPLLTQTALGSTITSIPGTLSGLTVGSTLSPATTTLVGVLKLTGGNSASVINPTYLSSLDNFTIGATVPAAATFTNLTVNGNITLNSTNISLSPSGSLTLGSNGQTINLQGNVSITGTQSFKIAPSDGSLVTIQPTATGSMDNMTIGALSAATGNFTTVTQTTVTTTNGNTNANGVNMNVGNIYHLVVTGSTGTIGSL